MLKAVKYRLYPTKEQEALFLRYFAACRYVYNIALEVKIYAYRAHGVNLSEFDLINQLTDAKKEHLWLQTFSAQTLANEITNLNKAFQQFFRRGGFPKFKGRFDKASCTFCQHCKIGDRNNIILPKVGSVKAMLHRKLEGNIKRITISQSSSGKFYASAIVEMEDNKHQLPSTGKAVGVDMGVRNLVTIHDSVSHDKVDLAGVIKGGKSEGMKQRLEHIQALIHRVQRHLSRKNEHRKRDKKERSKRQEKCRIRLARLKEKEAFIRANLLHEISCSLTNQYDTICIEDLAVKNMSRTAKGTVEDPGKNVKAKQSLNRVIVNSGLAMLRTQIEYKSAQKGRKVVVVSRWEPSSKNCSNCGFRNETLGSKTKWTCSNCGKDHDRDLNAAKNILAAGIAASDVLSEYSRGAEKKCRIKKSAKKVSIETITPENYPKRKEQKSRTKRIAAPQGVSDG